MPPQINYTQLDRILVRVFLIVGAVCLIIYAIVLNKFGDRIDVIEQNQKTSQERGYVLRALDCSILGAQVEKGDLPNYCFEENILKYYNPDKLPRTRSEQAADRNAVIYCSSLKDQGSVVAELEPCKSVLGD